MEIDGGQLEGEPPPIIDGKNCTVLHNSKRLKNKRRPASLWASVLSEQFLWVLWPFGGPPGLGTL